MFIKVKKMELLLKICLISIILFFCFLVIDVEAKYNFSINETIINLTRDTRIANYVVNYSNTSYTNQDITVIVTFDKEIEYLSGFQKIDETTFKKTYSQNITTNVEYKDYSGNKGYLKVDIRNIDKVLPQINGVSSGTLKAPLNLTYTDNVGVKTVEVERYSSYFSFEALEHYYDTESSYGLDVVNTVIRAKIKTKPLGTKKYKYYINNVLYSTSTKTSYTFTGVSPMTQYTVKVQAVDANGKVVGEQSKVIKTNCFDAMSGYKTNTTATLGFSGIDPRVERIEVAIWNGDNSNNIIWADTQYNKSTKNLTFVFNLSTFPYRNDNNPYRIHFHFKDASGNTIHIFPCNVRFGVTKPEDPSLNVNNVNKIESSGNYKITVTDVSGNKLEKYITVS